MKKTYKIWEKDEIDLLKKLYPTHNIFQILDYFPTRTRISIQRKVAKLELKKLPMRLGKVTKTQMAYLAGFFDGEGCVTIRVDKTRFGGRGHNYLCTTVSNTDREVLDHFRNVFGGGSCNLVQFYTPIGTLVHQWTVTGDRAYLILRAMYPYLRVKKAQAEVAMKFHEKRLKISLEEMRELARECRKKLTELKEVKKRQTGSDTERSIASPS